MTRARIRIAAGVLLVVAAGIGVWFYLHGRGRESTDDAQVDAHVTPIAARVGGTVARVAIIENQPVNAGDVLVEIDTRDYEVELARARAELADAEASAQAAHVNIPITATTTESNVASARSGVGEAQATVAEAEQAVAGTKARVGTAQARVRETEAMAAKAAKDVERLKTLLAKDEVAQQQYDAAVAAADSSRAAVDSARAQVTEAELAIKSAESRLAGVAHFGFGTAAGAAYGAVAPGVPLDPVLKGMAYGLAVWAGSYLGGLPALGVMRPATREPAGKNAVMIAAHLAWGAALGVVADRLSRGRRGP